MVHCGVAFACLLVVSELLRGITFLIVIMTSKSSPNCLFIRKSKQAGKTRPAMALSHVPKQWKLCETNGSIRGMKESESFSNICAHEPGMASNKRCQICNSHHVRVGDGEELCVNYWQRDAYLIHSGSFLQAAAWLLVMFHRRDTIKGDGR